MKYLRLCLFLFSIAAVPVFMGCSPTRKLDEAVTQRNANGRDVKLQYPQQFVATPANVNMVYDFEQIFSPVEVQKLDSVMHLFERSNLIPIKIVTLGPGKVMAGDFEKNNKSLLKEWDGLHGKAEKSMVISVSKAFNKVAIDYGSFVAKLLPDDQKNNIITAIFIPSFQNGLYYQGTWNGATAIMDAIRKNISFNPQPVQKK
ncbi:MAG TPA: TPM domain-containing protein [Niabella sp.]